MVGKRDPGEITFSQAQGYEDLPQPLQLEQLPPEARIQIWNLFYPSLKAATTTHGSLHGTWEVIMRAVHGEFLGLPLDEWNNHLSRAVGPRLRGIIQGRPFNKVFDLIIFTLRHPRCPITFIARMKTVFESCRLAPQLLCLR